MDWGKQHHHICLLDHKGQPSGECVVPHTGEGFLQLARWLGERTQKAAPATIGVVLETSRGPVVSCCQAQGYEVYAINPKQSDRFRDRYSTAGAKDDRRDALVLATILHTEPRALRQVEVADARCVQLRSRNRLRYDLLKTKVRLVLQMRQRLWEYFPSFDSLFGTDLTESFVHTLWYRIPHPRRGLVYVPEARRGVSGSSHADGGAHSASRSSHSSF